MTLCTHTEAIPLQALLFIVITLVKILQLFSNQC